MKGIPADPVNPAASRPALPGFDCRPAWRLALLAIILLLTMVCVWPAMHAPQFTDDIFQLERVSLFKKWSDIFRPDAFHLFRPLKNALFMMAAPYKANLPVWHAFGLMAYLLATLGIYRITSICLKSRRAALLATAVWALSPTCASTAIWLSCANISVGIALAACVFHCHERRMKGGGLPWVAGYLVFFGLALLCYETMIVIPGLLLLWDLQQRRIGVNRGTIVRYGLYAAVTLAFLVARHHFSARGIVGEQFQPTMSPETRPWQLSVSAPWFLWRHFLMWVFPFGTLEVLGSYIWLRSATPAGLLFGWVFMGALLGLAAALWRRFPEFSYGLLFFMVASLPAGNFIPNFNGPINDAYLSIPSIGLAMAFAVLCERLIREYPRRRAGGPTGLLLACAVILLLVYRLPVCAAYYRSWARVWNNEMELVVRMSESRSSQFYLKGGASLLLFQQGYVEGAEMMAKESLADAPWSEQGKLALARVTKSREDHTASEKWYREVILTPKISPNLKFTAMSELAHMLAALPGRQKDAADFCRELLKNERDAGKQNHIGGVLLLADLYENEGNKEKARATLERGLELHKDSDGILKQLAVLGTPESSSATKTQ